MRLHILCHIKGSFINLFFLCIILHGILYYIALHYMLYQRIHVVGSTWFLKTLPSLHLSSQNSPVYRAALERFPGYSIWTGSGCPHQGLVCLPKPWAFHTDTVFDKDLVQITSQLKVV